MFFSALVPKTDVVKTPWFRRGWGLFLCLFFGSSLVALLPAFHWFTLFFIVVALFCAWRFPWPAFFLALATMPFIGWIISFSTGQLQIGDRAFGGSIDITAGELVASIAILGWSIRLLASRVSGHRDWKPWLPFFGAYLILVLAHLASVFSFAVPDPLLVFKFSLRPVLLAYVVSVAFVVNFLQSPKRLQQALGVISTMGMIFAVDGFLSLFETSGALMRAHPTAWFGIYPLGSNHNVLAEWLLFTAPVAMALGLFLSAPRARLAAWFCAGFMLLVAMLTFARSAWITACVEIAFLAATVWRPYVRRAWRAIMIVWIALIPLFGMMVWFSLGASVQSSTDARVMLTGVSLSLFRSSPLIGVGAGTFVDHVARTSAYQWDFGGPIDAHGILQKLAAETGLFGLFGFVLVCIFLWIYGNSAWRLVRNHAEAERHAFFFLAAGMIGAFVYQLFNTTYWSPKLWLPVGIFYAATRIWAVYLDQDSPTLSSS